MMLVIKEFSGLKLHLLQNEYEWLVRMKSLAWCLNLKKDHLFLGQYKSDDIIAKLKIFLQGILGLNFISQ